MENPIDSFYYYSTMSIYLSEVQMFLFQITNVTICWIQIYDYLATQIDFNFLFILSNFK